MDLNKQIKLFRQRTSRYLLWQKHLQALQGTLQKQCSIHTEAGSEATRPDWNPMELFKKQ